MTLAIVYSRARLGINAPLVTVEAHLSRGLPGFSIVGLPETAVKESKDRVRSAIINSGFTFPVSKIVINLAPADLPKDSGRFDLPIAIGILIASRQIKNNNLKNYEFAGELALSGELRAISGVLPIAIAARKASRKLFVPEKNAIEASLPQDNEIFAVKTLQQAYNHLNNIEKINCYSVVNDKTTDNIKPAVYPDLKDIKGQPHAKRALEIAAAGRHNLLLIGPPGTGKTMLATRLPGIMPDLSSDEALEVALINSIANKPICWQQRPFRAPHHTASAVAIVGGGSSPRPGEVSLSNHGVLFLDELPEFERQVLEVLREPLESGTVTISRAARQVEFPAKFQLVAAMNPCPCGYLGDPRGRCKCTEDQTKRYRAKLSGPLIDRIDLHIEVPALSLTELSNTKSLDIPTSLDIQKKVATAASLQQKRAGKLNALLSNVEVDSYCKLPEDTKKLLHNALEKFGLSARAYHRILRVARTIADLDNEKDLQTPHVTEALSLRCLDRRHEM